MEIIKPKKNANQITITAYNENNIINRKSKISLKQLYESLAQALSQQIKILTLCLDCNSTNDTDIFVKYHKCLCKPF